jgi:hypothetical protein
LEAKVDNLRAALSPEYFTADSSVAYRKTVPAEALPFAEVAEVGGMSYAEGGTLKNAAVTALETVGMNLLDISAALNDALTDNGDGTYTIAKNGNSRLSEKIPIFVPAGQKLFAYFELVDTNMEKTLIPLQFFKADGTSNGSSGALVDGGGTNTPAADTYFMRLYLRDTDADGSYITFKNPMIKYGERANFSPYIKRIYPIPAEVQALDGWGAGVDAEHHNRLDWAKKQYRQEVARVRLPSAYDAGG